MIKALSPTILELPTSSRWVIEVRVLDDDGCRVGGVVPTVTVTPPSGPSSPVTVEPITDGGYRGVFTSTASVGRYTAVAEATGYGLVNLVAYVFGSSTAPTATDVRGYAGTLSQSDDQINAALATEAAAQRRVCRVPAVLPADLREALIRRVVVNLDKRKQRNTQVPEEGGPRFIPLFDPEIRRLEGPHRKWAVA